MTLTFRATRRLYQQYRVGASGGPDGQVSNPLSRVTGTCEIFVGNETQRTQIVDSTTNFGAAAANYIGRLVTLTSTPPTVGTAGLNKFDNWPFALFLVNHLKEKKDESTGRVELTMPGGDFSSFQESFELHTSVWREKIDTEGFDGVGVRIKCKKNGLGIKNRQVRTRMLWWEEWNEELEEYQQKTVWDWDWATTALLYDLPGKYKTRLKELDFDIQFKSPDANVECFAQSKALGMGKDQWETFADVGKMIRENTEVMELLRTALFIKRRALMKGDYLEQLDTMLGEME